METGSGAGPDDLTHLAQLARSPEQFHIFHALRIIEASFPDAPRLGESARPLQDRVRLGQEAELAFPPSTIVAMVLPVAGQPWRLTNRFFGLFGPNGPLPIHMTEFARDRLRNHRDSTLVGFANMLTHRLMGLLYRAWAASQPAVSFDRPGTDRFERKVAALTGHYAVHLRNRDAMPDLAKRHFAGHLASGPKHAQGLVSMVSAFARAPVALQQFVGSWLELEPGDRWQLGAQAGLGQATSIGDRVWSRAAKFRLQIGPLPLAEYRRLLPGSSALDRLEAIVRNYVGDVLDWDINLVLQAGEVPQAILGQNVSLGQVFWIGARKPGSDADDLYLTPKSAQARIRLG